MKGLRTCALYGCLLMNFAAGSAWAAGEDPAGTGGSRPPPPEQAIGISVGWVAANGLSYRRYFDHNYIQTTFVGLVDRKAGQGYLDLSVGAGRYLNRFDLEHFAPIGLKLGGGIETEYRKGTDYVESGGTQRKIHIGAGFGADIGNPAAHGVILSIDIFYTATFEDFASPEFTTLKLLPSISLHYNL